MSRGSTNFLRKFKYIVTQGRGLDLIPRPQNNETIIKLGLTKQIVKDIILSLNENNYCSGPKPNDNHPNQVVWIFGEKIDGVEIYIKLSIAKVNDIEIAKCISFHETTYPLNYPLRTNRGNKGSKP